MLRKLHRQVQVVNEDVHSAGISIIKEYAVQLEGDNLYSVTSWNGDVL